MACLDTSFIVDLIRGSKEVNEFLPTLRKERTLFIPTPSIVELWEGLATDRVRKGEKERVVAFLHSVEMLTLTEEAAIRAAETRILCRRLGIALGRVDAMIAGIALQNGESLVTRDVDFARIPGLRVIKY